MIVAFLIWWHTQLVNADIGEVEARLREGSANDKWMVNTLTHINWRLDRIDALRAQRTMARANRWLPMTRKATR